MKILDLTFDVPEEDLACDEALLEAAENGLSGEVLRFWTPKKLFVVMGYSDKTHENIDLEACRKERVPVLRRISGGGTILEGPGCLNYSLILKIGTREALAGITSTNRFVMDMHRRALEPLVGAKITVRGITDLALGDLKFSGNAQRRKKHFVLFHGTFLLDFDIAEIEKFLKMPPRRPEYRRSRRHKDFLVNAGLEPGKVKKTLSLAWGVSEKTECVSFEKIKDLAADRYSKDEWNLKF